MSKSGKQIHDEYWNHYRSIPKNSKKSDLGKKHTKLFREYRFKKIIGELVDMSGLDLQCADIKLERREIVEIIYYLFYPHLRLAKDIIEENTIARTEFIKPFFDGLQKYENKTDFSPYFNSRNDTMNFSDYSSYREKVNEKLRDKKMYNQIPAFLRYFIFSNLDDSEVITYSYLGLVSQLMQVMSVMKNSNKKFKACEYNAASQWYHRLFNENHQYFFDIAGENKHLEQQLLDMYYGFSLIGYLYRKKINLESDFIDACGYLRMFGLSSGIIKILDRLVSLYYKEDKFAYNEYDSVKDETHKFAKNVLKIFREFMLGFVEYVYHLGTYENRKKYFKHASRKEPSYDSFDCWKCILLNKYSDIDLSKIAKLAMITRLAEISGSTELTELDEITKLTDLAEQAIQAALREPEKLAELAEIAKNITLAEPGKKEKMAKRVNLSNLTEIVRLSELSDQTEITRLTELAKLAEQVELTRFDDLRKLVRLAEQSKITNLKDLARITELAEDVMLISNAYNEEYNLDLDEFYLFQDAHISFTNILDLCEEIDDGDEDEDNE